MIRKMAAIALLACLASGKASADFLHTDWQADGDSLATLHEETGLEWLKINSTLGIFASSSVSSEISKGGSRRYTGYNIARLRGGLR